MTLENQSVGHSASLFEQRRSGNAQHLSRHAAIFGDRPSLHSLFIAQCLDRVLARGPQRRIDRAHQAACQSSERHKDRITGFDL